MAAATLPVLVRIALRNMREHKAKSAIIGILVALGVIVIVLGNALMDSAAAGTRAAFIESFTGDIMIHGPSESAVTVFGVQSISMDADTETPTVPARDRIAARLKADPRVERATSMAVAYGLLAMDADETIEDSRGEDQENVSFAIVFGVDADTYFAMFPSVEVLEGRTVRNGESAAMLTRGQLERLGKKYGRPFAVGDKLLITGFGTAGMRIREVEIVGVFERKGGGTSPAPFMFADIDTVRVLAGLTLGTGEDLVLDEKQTALLSAGEDDLFADAAGMVAAAAPPEAKPASFESAAALLGDTTKRDLLNQADSGAWHFVLVRLKNSGDADREIADLTGWFKDEGIDARAVGWKAAAGSFAQFADIVRIVFNAALVVISIVAVIIMMNTLVVSVIERTAEIGTMRALGAPRNFIRRMFLTETLTLTVVFGAIGSLVALAVVIGLNALGIKASGDLQAMLYGGEILRLAPNAASFAGTLVMVFAVGWLAHLYPVSVALKIPPVKAMQAE